MRYVGIALLLRDGSSQEVRLIPLVPRIGPSRDPQAGGSDGCASKRLARRTQRVRLRSAIDFSAPCGYLNLDLFDRPETRVFQQARGPVIRIEEGRGNFARPSFVSF